MGPLFGQTSLICPSKAWQYINIGVFSTPDTPINTPHQFYINNDIYMDIYDKDRMECAVTASIEAIFIMLGHSHLTDKILSVLMKWKIWSSTLLTRSMDSTSIHIKQISQLLKSSSIPSSISYRWPGTSTKKLPPYMMLGFSVENYTISQTVSWLHYHMSHIHSSITATLCHALAHLISTNHQFCSFFQQIKGGRNTTLNLWQVTFAYASAAWLLHHSKQAHPILPTLCEELTIITTALCDPPVSKKLPIAHLVSQNPSALTASDSSLHATGGWSMNIHFWC